MLTAIIVAGGSSRRMGFDKTFALLRDRAVIAHSISAFDAAESVDEIVLVGREERLEELQALVREHRFGKVKRVIAGGIHRQDSVRAGLEAVGAECRYIAVHDAARPLTTATQIARVYEAARIHGAATLAAPVSDTLKRADAEGFVCESLDREGVFAMQTPQMFSRELLSAAYERIEADNVSITDEVSALQHLGRKVMLVPADDVNLKITFPADLALAELVLSRRRAGG
jgi:2-C-methyl-D-erythritol 4-phosphate cytidylyltransferase